MTTVDTGTVSAAVVVIVTSAGESREEAVAPSSAWIAEVVLPRSSCASSEVNDDHIASSPSEIVGSARSFSKKSWPSCRTMAVVVIICPTRAIIDPCLQHDPPVRPMRDCSSQDARTEKEKRLDTLDTRGNVLHQAREYSIVRTRRGRRRPKTKHTKLKEKTESQSAMESHDCCHLASPRRPRPEVARRGEGCHNVLRLGGEEWMAKQLLNLGSHPCVSGWAIRMVHDRSG